MKVESIEIKNFKAIKSEKIDIKGNNVYVLGKNAVGKTSFLDAIFKIISGKDLPTKLTTQDEKNGYVIIDIGDFIIKSTFNEAKERVSLTIESKNGATYKSPRTMLDGLAGVIDFDINNFFILPPKKQVEFIKQLIGIDFNDLDNEYEEAYKERTFINRKLKELESQARPFDKDNINPIDLTQLQADITAKRAHNKTIEDVKNRYSDRQIQIELKESQIEALQKEITELSEKNKQAAEYLLKPKNKEFNIGLLEEQFSQAIEENKIIEENIKNSKLYEEIKETESLHTQIESKIQEIQETKLRIISEANIPVPGLSFNDEGLTYCGLPFEAAQINKAQQIIIGLQINLALLGDIKIARFDGSLLDSENMDYIEKWAKKKDLQLFVEFVDRSSEKLKIEIREQQS